MLGHMCSQGDIPKKLINYNIVANSKNPKQRKCSSRKKEKITTVYSYSRMLHKS